MKRPRVVERTLIYRGRIIRLVREVFMVSGRWLARGVRRPEPDELLRPVTLSLASALAKIRSGVICDAKSIIGVLFAARVARRPHLKRSRNSATLALTGNR